MAYLAGSVPVRVKVDCIQGRVLYRAISKKE